MVHGECHCALVFFLKKSEVFVSYKAKMSVNQMVLAWVPRGGVGTGASPRV